MSDSNSIEPEPRKKRFSRLGEIFKRRPEPEDREDIKAILQGAHERGVIDTEAYSMVFGALDVASKTVADIMVPRSKIDILDITRPLAELLPTIVETGRSRFPVYEDDRDNIVGILLAKDLLLSIANPTIDLRPLVRPAVFIPETKRLNVLLHEFRSSRNHIAIVIDEHGGTAGLITMEDVLEQIVGDIEDEYDEDEEQTIFQAGNNGWRVMAVTEIADFNEAFGTALPDDEYDTIGGWLAYELGHIPRRGDTVTRQGMVVTVVRADAKRALWLHVQRDTPELSSHNN
ncbi:CBS domain-containing protein [Paenalcaligenes niemegkensis]|uniref:HlyC/CorC family transporter n=1 Tax=Paenalcaligenes niemegkensis TaxID=2895469 RepID=UPI001EE979FA|nr:transporter associated domain-containing protein [Paenalcaligenes niemegkensis]MCQ9617170.1 CBS domain-containing protein [Paenalcaligenes niemegkensis]